MDLLILPNLLFYENATDFFENPPFADSSKTLLHSHRNALAESANPQPADVGVTVALQVNSGIQNILEYK